ncbi:MAG TPA: serine/threonine-protein kinase [Nitriliruptorales bacterium]
MVVDQREDDEHPDLLEPIGAGGRATVWRAWHRGRVVAVKRPADGSPEAVERLEREARLAARIAHPRVLPVSAQLRTPDGPLLVQPYAIGGSLADRLARHGALAPCEAVQLAAQVAEALTAVHAAGIVHRDVKPANVLLDGAGGPLLADFGAAVTAREAAAGTRPAEGSPAYAAPETLTGHASPRADLFGLGATLYEALTGSLAATGDPGGAGIETRLRRSVPGLPPALTGLVASCLAADPEGRPDSAAVVRARLLELVEPLRNWQPDADAALAAWAAQDDPRVTRTFGPRPPRSVTPTPGSSAPSPLAVAVAAIATFVAPIAVAGLLT